ncbi:hypothetical protein TNCV_592391 [Trichonephila clavipes]|nr:hypothetical protein TNCV_592391 [Trichonephila clavipes]
MRSKCLTTAALNSRRATIPLVRLLEGEERWETPGHLQGVVLSQNWGGTEPKHTVACMKAKATASDRRTSSPES